MDSCRPCSSGMTARRRLIETRCYGAGWGSAWLFS